VSPIEAATRVAREIARKSGHEALTWEEANKSALVSFRMMGIVTYFLVVFTALVGGFGILNIMVTIVMEKVKDIAILRAMGLTRPQVLRVFFAEALILGAAGGLLGLLAGTALSLFIESMSFTSSDASQIQRDVFTMLLAPSYYLIAFALSLFVSVAAGMFPARRASRVDPVEVLRGER
jgi:lipoprotein-releasing system permease protein